MLDQIKDVKSDKEEIEKLITPKKGRPSDFKQKLIEAYAESVNEESVTLNQSNINDAFSALEAKIQRQIAISKAMTVQQLMKIEEYPYEINGISQTYCGGD